MQKSNLKEVEKYFNKTFDEIFHDNEKYITITINKFYNKYRKTIWKDDIKQCAMIGLANAIETLDLNRVDSFENHIITNIRKEVLYFENEIFGAKGYSKRDAYDEGIESLNKTLDNGENRDSEMIDMVAATLDVELDVIKKIDLYRAIELLNETEKATINMLLENKTQQHIAKVLGISEPTVTQRLKKIYKKLGKVLK